MSGIVALLNLDKTPIDPELLQVTTEHMAYRGPDDLQIWVDGSIGMGHTAFHTTTESWQEKQPITLDGRVWLNAYARLDGRAQLIRELKGAGRQVHHEVSDTELILHAYQTWKGGCLHHLIGDFAFIIWDAPEKRLFCARDQLGIRPLYYSIDGNTLIVGNTLSCLRRYPGTAQILDELAIIDFLLFGYYTDLEMTAYSAIRRVPPAHTLSWSAGTLKMDRYWSVPADQPLNYQRAETYIDHFAELFQKAVSDRLRTEHIAISMSGGLDSTSVAAMSAKQLAQYFDSWELHAFTNVFGTLIPDDEDYFARLTASTLNIPIHIRKVDEYSLFERWGELDLQTNEPADNSLAAWSYDEENEIAAYARVTLSGLGGDPLFFPETGYLYALLEQRRFNDLLLALKLCRQTRKYPPLYLRTWLRRRLGKRDRNWPRVQLPSWLNPDLIQEYKLDERWRIQIERQRRAHPRRPQLVSGITSSFWPFLLESYDSEHGFVPHETRHPFFDLRLLRFILRIPPVPWCINKHLLRSAMKGHLPPKVLHRPKKPLSGYPQHPICSQTGPAVIDHLSNSGHLVSRFGNLRAALDMLVEPERETTAAYISSLRLVGLASWLDGNQK